MEPRTAVRGNERCDLLTHHDLAASMEPRTAVRGNGRDWHGGGKGRPCFNGAKHGRAGKTSHLRSRSASPNRFNGATHGRAWNPPIACATRVAVTMASMEPRTAVRGNKGPAGLNVFR